jgi:hypothetical protein
MLLFTFHTSGVGMETDAGDAVAASPIQHSAPSPPGVLVSDLNPAAKFAAGSYVSS